MDMLKRLSLPVAVVFSAAIFLLLLFDPNADAENEYVLLTFNALFTGVLPILVSVIAGRAYVNNRIVSALLMGCGMLIFGVGSISSGFLRFLPDSGNLSVTLFNLCALTGSALNLIAALFEKQPARTVDTHKRNLLLLAVAYVGAICFVGAIVPASFGRIVPEFIDEYGFTATRTTVIWMAIVFFFGAAVAFCKQYQTHKSPYLYWYSLSLIMTAVGLFGVYSARLVGSPLSWLGRACQYFGGVCALVSMLSVLTAAKEKGVSTTDIMADFFGDAEACFRDLMEASPCAVINVDEEFRIFHINSAAGKLFMCDETENRGKSFLDLFVREGDRDLLRGDMDRFKTTGRSSLMGKATEMEAFGCDGRRFPAELYLTFRRLPRGFAGICLVRDVTDRKRTETALKEQAAELERKNRLVTDFFINISHEFKTPLSIIMLGIDLLERKAGAQSARIEDISKNIAMMRQNTYRLGRLVGNLLDITKLDAGFMEPKWESVDVVEHIGALVRSTEGIAAQKSIRMCFSCSPDSLGMLTDGFMLERIVLNLLSNAIKHTPPGGRIGVDVRALGNRVAISVRDDGEGIPEEKQGIIFDRFKQVNTSLTRSSEGCGIGLALTKSLVELLYGRICVNSEYGRGSEFVVELPVIEMEIRRLPVDQNGLHLDKRVQMELSDIGFCT